LSTRHFNRWLVASWRFTQHRNPKPGHP